ncbi:putative drug exporter of the RND superfamily [Nonomuraea jiangxiensis]|uniref:Putative drug exporter of the RND superfamily n=2 Tax=Nonomuraea jiangxiensis TaxID=633440 RepID=A0A1G9BH27_9ACTN|nr:putative drug exporter of the RND superfamily [Nonomuraea jiangxiensis]
MFSWLGHFAHARRRALLIATALFVVLAGAWGGGVFGALSTGGLESPHAESYRANELLEGHFGHRPAQADAVAIYSDPTGELSVDDPAFRKAVTAALSSLPQTEVVSWTSYWSPELTEEQRSGYVSTDGHATLATIILRGADDQERLESYGEIEQQMRAQGLETHIAGGSTSVFHLQRLATENLATANMISLPILLLLLLVVFRGVVAAAIPLALGIMAILGSLVMLRALTYVTDVSIFAMEISMLLGLGLAIDYGLFMVSRFREELARTGGDVRQSLVATMKTAGHTVAFSGLTVVIGLCGLMFFPQPISQAFGFGGIAVVLFDLLAALVVLPAVLAVLGSRINALSLPWPRRRAGAVTRENRAWNRLATSVTRRPLPWLAGGLLALLVAAAPLLSLQQGLTNHRYLPAGNEGQVVPRMLVADFPQDGPAGLRMDVAIAGPVRRAALDDYLRSVEGIQGAGVAGVHLADSELTWATVAFRGEADDADNLQLVRDIRALEPPAGATEVLVGGGGGPAVSLDNSDATMAALPWALAFIGLSTLFLLFLAFRSVLVPVKAVVVAFLSLAASCGLIVWGFQEGGLAGLMDFSVVGTTDVWALGLIITIAFGLVTDYEMFLVSRISEEYRATGDNRRAIIVGLRGTGSLITRAGLLMVVVLATMGFTATSLFLMTIGVGLTLCVVIDATLVRAIVVPAAMQLLGGANWWPGRPRGSNDRPRPTPRTEGTGLPDQVTR